MRLIIKPVRADNMSIHTQNNTVFVKGSIDMQMPGKILEPFFTELHNDLMNYGFKFLTLDITEMNFINSSGLREILAWLMKIIRLPKDDRYDIYLKIDPSVNCQSGFARSISLLYQGVKVVNFSER